MSKASSACIFHILGPLLFIDKQIINVSDKDNNGDSHDSCTCCTCPKLLFPFMFEVRIVLIPYSNKNSSLKFDSYIDLVVKYSVL